MKEIKMIPANIDSTIMIREKDANFYHAQIIYRMLDPRPDNDGTFFIFKTEVRPIRDCDYPLIFGGTTEQQLQARKAIGAYSIDLIHNPLPTRSKETKDVKKESAISEHKFREGKRRATIADVKNILESKE